jgi:Glycosyl transferase family 2
MSVTVVIPAFNAATTIVETLASVARQTHKDWQCVIVDDGSEDDTVSVLERAISRLGGGRFHVLRQPKNLGLPATRNAAIKTVHSTHIALVDADDIWEDEHLEESLTRLEESSADFVGGRVTRFDGATGLVTDTWGPTRAWMEDMPRSLAQGWSLINPSTWVYKAKVHQEIGLFDESLRAVEDMDFLFRLLCARQSVAITETPTVRQRLHPGQITKNAARMAEYTAKVLAKHSRCGLVCRQQMLSQAGHLYEVAARGNLADSPWAAAGLFWRSWQVRKSQVRLLAHVARAAGLAFLRSK